jgi:hypothetical protein
VEGHILDRLLEKLNEIPALAGYSPDYLGSECEEEQRKEPCG